MVSLRPVNVFREGALGGIEIEVGAEDGIRTRDLRFTKPLLYQLSYFGLKAETREHATHWPSRKLPGIAISIQFIL